LIDSFRLVTDSELKQLHTSWVDEYGKLVMRNETTRTRRACETVRVTSRQRHPTNKKSMNPARISPRRSALSSTAPLQQIDSVPDFGARIRRRAEPAPRGLTLPACTGDTPRCRPSYCLAGVAARSRAQYIYRTCRDAMQSHPRSSQQRLGSPHRRTGPASA